MALRWFKTIFMKETKQYNIYREYCKSINPEQRLKENPYFDKYAKKISDVQKVSPEKLQEMLDDKFVSPKNFETMKTKPEINFENKKEMPKFCGHKDLNQIMNLEAVEHKSTADIETIWKQYHESKDGLYAVLPKGAYVDMHSKMKQYPVFLFPLPRAQGYEFIMLQVQDHSCYFTSLLNYQAFKENAPVSLTINYFTDLMDKKDIVLMRGEYDEKVLKVHEAQCLANQLQLYYGSKNAKKENLLRTFNKQPQSFKHTDLISNFEYDLAK